MVRSVPLRTKFRCRQTQAAHQQLPSRAHAQPRRRPHLPDSPWPREAPSPTLPAVAAAAVAAAAADIPVVADVAAAVDDVLLLLQQWMTLFLP